jgi:hypothetical protein
LTATASSIYESCTWLLITRRILELLFCLWILLASTATTAQIDYKTQVGIVEPGDRSTCMTIFNSGLKPHQTVKIITGDKPQDLLEGEIAAVAEKNCSHDPNQLNGDVHYLIHLANDQDLSTMGLALVNYTGAFKVIDGLYGFNMRSDGSLDFFRSCSSNEGIHMSVWSGPPLRGTRRWHRYFYLGYDVEANCNEKDYEDSGSGSK